MRILKKSILVPLLCIGFIGLFGLLGLRAQEHEKIVETVQVENIEIPVRVFNGNQPVGDLKKEDFEFFVNGKKTEINGFYETRKKLETSESTGKDAPGEIDVKMTPRLFVLIFNLSSYTQDFHDKMDLLFKRIIRPDDRVIVITNRFFLPEWEVMDPEKTKNKIIDVLDKETHQLKVDLTGFEVDLKSISTTLKSRLSDPNEGANPSSILEEFFLNYQFILEDIKEKFLGIPVNQYIKISEYLKAQPMNKWVLNFYQLGRLPMIDSYGEVNRFINKYLERTTTGRTGMSGGPSEEDPKEVRVLLEKVYYKFITDIKAIDNLLINDICKAFINSGAVVHTQLLNPPPRSFSTDYKYETINIESESILKELSRLTGGRILTSNRTDKFIDKITAGEDIVYFLTYVPLPGQKRVQKLDINVKGKNYRVVYDNRKRLKYFNEIMTKLASREKDIEIESLSYQNDQLTVKLKNLRLVRYEGEEFGAVQARIKITDKQSRLISNYEKIFKGIKEQGIFQVTLPPTTGGQYHVVLEVKDLFALKSVYVGDAISISK